ncbi:hypothetical protein [Albimonas pacifica]|uniref:Cysteine rich repeat-containing protein n=1 Tax=Albimonas pacifica TaxID=1114924 RepID=A0A1I3JWM2_9RHOB|nr:hypothetical protein [Albimonas pacifica]SFI64631.1 hypothetical protein SAMN05216258_108191 [Albimonas pacifica]
MSRPRLSAAALALAALVAAAPALLAPPSAQGQGAATSRGLPGGAGGVTVRRGGEAQPGPNRPGVAPAPAPVPAPAPGPGAGFSAPGAGRLLDIDRTVPCVQAAKPDMSQAILCYRPLLEICPEDAEPDDRLACRRRVEPEWTALAARFGDQPMTRMLAGAFDPAACETFAAPGKTPEEARLDCRITARATQTIYGHIESLWGGLGPGLRPGLRP